MDISSLISLLPSSLVFLLPVLSLYSPQAQLSWESASVQPFKWSSQNLATCKHFQKMKSWCATRESRHEMLVGLMGGFYFELTEYFKIPISDKVSNGSFLPTFSSVSSLPLTPSFVVLLTCKLSLIIYSSILKNWQVLHVARVATERPFCFHNLYYSLEWKICGSGWDAYAAF